MVTPEDVARGFYSWLRGAHELSDFERTLLKDGDIQEAHYRREALYLRVFAIDYAMFIWGVEGHEREGEAVRLAWRHEWRASLGARTDGLYEASLERSERYGEAMNADGFFTNTLKVRLETAFVGFLNRAATGSDDGDPPEKLLVAGMFAAKLIFGSTFNGITEMLRSMPIKALRNH